MISGPRLLWCRQLGKDKPCSLVSSSELYVVPSRSLTHFRSVDESTDVYVVLRTSYLEEDALKRFISRLTIRVEAHVVNVQSQSRQDGQATPTRDLIFSDTLKESEDPMTVFQAPDHDRDEGDPGHVFVFWKLKASLSTASRFATCTSQADRRIRPPQSTNIISNGCL